MQDTIAAIATPPGEGGIHVIRLSGEQTLSVVRQVFMPHGGQSVDDIAPRYATYGELRDPSNETLLDSVLVTLFAGPNSYTGEDVAEISCHGGTLVSQRILECLLGTGARLAHPGEFTRRAFVNNKLDLTQAEAVADLIHAVSDRAQASALSHLEGRFSNKLNDLYTRLLEVLSHLETAIDFPEEGLEFQQKEAMRSKVEQVRAETDRLAGTFRQGRIVREGLKIILIGKPNTGKSSLLNALLAEDRAIVTPHPGTTRDVLEERIRLNDIHLTLLDTAGLRRDAEAIEEEGIRRTRQALAQADLALLMFDGSEVLDDNDHRLIEEVKGKASRVVINKSDRPLVWNLKDLPVELDQETAVNISATEGTGLEHLKEVLYQFATAGFISGESLVITRERHFRNLEEVSASLERVCQSLSEDQSEDLIAVDMNQALDGLGRLLGKDFAVDLLDQIFDDFCIGK